MKLQLAIILATTLQLTQAADLSIPTIKQELIKNFAVTDFLEKQIRSHFRTQNAPQAFKELVDFSHPNMSPIISKIMNIFTDVRSFSSSAAHFVINEAYTHKFSIKVFECMESNFLKNLYLNAIGESKFANDDAFKKTVVVYFSKILKERQSSSQIMTMEASTRTPKIVQVGNSTHQSGWTGFDSGPIFKTNITTQNTNDFGVKEIYQFYNFIINKREGIGSLILLEAIFHKEISDLYVDVVLDGYLNSFPYKHHNKLLTDLFFSEPIGFTKFVHTKNNIQQLIRESEKRVELSEAFTNGYINGVNGHGHRYKYASVKAMTLSEVIEKHYGHNPTAAIKLIKKTMSSATSEINVQVREVVKFLVDNIHDPYLANLFLDLILETKYKTIDVNFIYSLFIGDIHPNLEKISSFFDDMESNHPNLKYKVHKAKAKTIVARISGTPQMARSVNIDFYGEIFYEKLLLQELRDFKSHSTNWLDIEKVNAIDTWISKLSECSNKFQ